MPHDADKMERAGQSDDRVVVIGGGLAGIAAAVRLAEDGVPVTLLETRKRLGGRATSISDPKSGRQIDNCQHVLMRCCTNLVDFYCRLGVEAMIDWHDRVYFASGEGRIDVLQAGRGPAPLHLSRAIRRLSIFSRREVLAIARGMWKLMRPSPSELEQADAMSFAQWLSAHRQPPRVVELFWLPVVVSALNETPECCSWKYARMVLCDGFCRNREAYVMGVSRVTLAKLYDPAQRIIESAGGKVCFSAGVRAMGLYNGRVRSVTLADGQTVEGGRFISAVPADRLSKLVTDDMRHVDARLRSLTDIAYSPIIGIHLWFDRPVSELPHLALLGSPLHWIFVKRRGETLADGQKAYLAHGVISAAHELVGQSEQQLIDLSIREIHRVQPTSREASLLHGRVIREKRATFSITPGLDVVRPSTTGVIENLYLAGDWTATGWPATMEGAVRSGYRAAAAVLAATRGKRLPRDIMPDLPPSWLYRLLAR